ncbi:MAG: hypothetical protein GX071_08170 [Gammaproteobacteria bacterium]|nr:hypothetical protein [Gammaproteobacteria bacterium]
MRGLAEYIMRGRREATLAVAIATAIPLLFWFSAAAVALVILRRGLSEALPILAWGLLPAVVWAVVGDLTPLLVIAGSAGLAVVLRQHNDWLRVVLLAVPLGVVFGLVLLTALSEPLQALAGNFRELLPELLEQMGVQLDEANRALLLARLDQLMIPLLGGVLGAMHMLMALVSLMIGRYWQAGLYNPGGFRQEFQQLRLPPLAAISLLVLVVLAPQWPSLALLSPVASVPLLLAGLALLHAVVGARNLGKGWLVGIYVLLVLFIRFAYPLIVFLAFVDSLFDFRSRMRRQRPPRDDDDPNSQG